jgi:hypothetical protein
MEAYGFQVSSDLTSEAQRKLVKKLSTDITDISEIYTLDQLLMIYDAVHGDDKIIPMDKRQPRFTTEVKVEPRKIDSGANRKKIRIDLTTDSSYASTLLEHLCKYDNLDVQEIKTGLAIKHVVGEFKSNIANFNELRTINGELHGNLYFNQIRNEADYEKLDIKKECKWFRGYAQLPKVNVYDVIDYLNDKNLYFLRSLSAVSNKRRLTNKKRLLLKGIA